VLPLSDATRLLAAADSVAALSQITAALGFEPPAALPRAARDTFAIPPDFARAEMARGPGGLRALLLELRGEMPMRDALRRLADRLAVHAPHALWLVLTVRPGRDEVALATWHTEGGRASIAALLVERAQVRDSDAQTLAALAASRDGTDVLTHSRWAELLGREALTARFYRTLERVVAALADSLPHAIPADDRSTLALLAVSRLLFLSFLETKGWLDGDRAFLMRTFDDAMRAGGEYHRRILAPLWFGTLNTPMPQRAAVARGLGRIPFLNGGLFSRSPLERRWKQAWCSDEALGAVFRELLQRFRFTPREDREGWSESAIDPEMLGLAFESLMASRQRKATGAFYTPPSLVATVTRAALEEALVGGSVTPAHLEDALRGRRLVGRAARVLEERAASLTVLDPACGSGAFLVHVLEALATIRQAGGDPRPIAAIRRDVLSHSIHGVDINPTAVWLCELRLWLSVVIEHDEPDPRRVPPLPNLDRHVRVGDALGGGDYDDASPIGARRLAPLRLRYARATGHRKEALAKMLDTEERRAAIGSVERALVGARHARAELVRATRQRDLFGERRPPSAATRAELTARRDECRRLEQRRRALRDGAALPFAFATHFADASATRGFGLVIGNPPWVRLHQIPAEQRAEFKRRFVVHRQAAWAEGAARAGAATGFAAQVDLASLFVERALSLTADGGQMALLVPAKLWRSLAGGGVRQFLTEHSELRRLEDWSHAPATFDAAVYPSIVVATRRRAAHRLETPTRTNRDMDAVVRTRVASVRWGTPPERLAFDSSRGSPWLLLPPPARRAFDAMRAAGTPLVESSFGRPLLGVKTGCNEAFLVRTSRGAAAQTVVRHEERSALLETRWLRPVVRGESMARWRIPSSADALVWPHGEQGPLATLPPDLAHWLAPHRRALTARADVRGARTLPWWSLFRTEGARDDMPRVVWADFGRSPQAAVLDAGDRTVPLNTCYIARAATMDDALALTTLLNSPIIAAWLAVLAEPARGGWKRYLGWTLSLLPLPRDWGAARDRLAPIAAAARRGDVLDAHALWPIVAESYGIEPTDLRPLLEWSHT
jgi:hypothetical protein